jgi:hypothetical protein
MVSKPKVLAGILGVVIVVIVGLLIWSSANGGGTTKVAQFTRPGAEPLAGSKSRLLERKITRQERKAEKRDVAEKEAQQKAEIERSGIDGSPENATEASSSQPSKKSRQAPASSSSFGLLESEISGEIGVAYAPLGSPEAQSLGPLQVGHAWSSFKVPISVTVMSEQGGSLDSNQESLVASAITASDNAAAAALFSELESMTGGRASQAVEQTLSEAGAPTAVATAPPPPGAVSSWGQTEWPLTLATRFYNALACGAYGGETATILGDMESVTPEQQWGLGQTSFPSGASVAFKAGWGPDGSESGPYLVRQSGIIRSDTGGAVVTIAAQDASGSFEAGVSDLDRVADWVAQNVPLDGNC